MPTIAHVCPTELYCSLHINPTLLHTSTKNQSTETFIYHTTAKYMSSANMPPNATCHMP